jgi:glycosyltransferase involved in cell wall biosynthesis
MMLGFRGFPEVQGGVERHAENLCPLLSRLGCDIEALARPAYLPKSVGKEQRWQGVRVRSVWAPRLRGLEAALHSLFGVLLAIVERPDILHIQAIGPALWTPLARLFGLRVVFTHHGADYERQKWGRAAKWVLRFGEFLGVRFANRCIAISSSIAAHIDEQYGRPCDILPNGVMLPTLSDARDTLDRFDLEKGRFVLMVGRLVPEKRHLDLIAAFQQAHLTDWKLVLVGGADHPDAYSLSVERAARETENVIFVGFQTGDGLAQLYTHTGLFVLPSSHEGLPIALLEALSYGVPVLASDIPANREIGLPEDNYFSLGDITILAERMRSAASFDFSARLREVRREWVVSRYSWNEIARDTVEIYTQCLTAPKASSLTKVSQQGPGN